MLGPLPCNICGTTQNARSAAHAGKCRRTYSDCDPSCIEENKLLGQHEAKDIYLCFGKYGYYLKYGEKKNFSIPLWSQKETFDEQMDLEVAITIIDWKIKNNVPRGEAVCKELTRGI